MLDDYEDIMDAIERLPVLRGYETTSHHFNHSGSVADTPSGDQPDEFTSATIDELFEKLIRLRNEVCFSRGIFLMTGCK
jgi:hypothetical protein